MKIRALSLWQPHATAIALGIKPYETRGWQTDYRGPLVIHAAKNKFHYKDYRLDYYQEVCSRLEAAGFPPFALPYGEAVCIVNLVDCVRTETLRGRIGDNEFWGDFSDGRWAFKLENPYPIDIKCNGRQKFFSIDVPEQSLGPYGFIGQQFLALSKFCTDVESLWKKRASKIPQKTDSSPG